MRRLYWQIYATLVGIIVLFTVLLSVAFAFSDRRESRGLAAMASIAEELLPPREASAEEVEQELRRLHAGVHVSAALWGADRRLIAAVGEPLPPPSSRWAGSRFLSAREGYTIALALSDGRWLIARHERLTHGSAGFVAVVLLSGVAVAVGAYPLVRRLTRRLERLQSHVDALGEGDLAARVEVEGRDEVADLARSFNRAAGRIERLVDAQKTLLAGASHELRSPLARIRVATELLGGDGPSDLKAGIARDVEELDELIAELLLASRLDATESLSRPGDSNEVELLALSASEAARVGASVSGEEVWVLGDATLLRRALRNLLANATRHAEGSSVEVSVRREQDRAVVAVTDAGPGVPEEERSRLFEAFYRGARARLRPEEGVGLGLFLVERIARHHGGAVRLVPSDSGARFELVVPASTR